MSNVNANVNGEGGRYFFAKTIIFQLVCVQDIVTKDWRDIPLLLVEQPRVILSFYYMLQIVF